jgi:prevent-host-death family protein
VFEERHRRLAHGSLPPNSTSRSVGARYLRYLQERMSVTELSARDLNRDVSAAKRAADVEAVVITDHGRPSYVLMLYAEYERLAGAAIDLVDTGSPGHGGEPGA